MRVLVAVDDPVAAHIIDAVARRFGHHVQAAPDVRTATREMLRGEYLLVILDASLAGGGGRDLVERIRGQSGGDGPYILLVAEEGRADDVTGALDAGANDYIWKPIRPVALELRIRLAQKRLAQRIEERERLTSFEELLASSSELIQTVRPDGQLLFANRAWFEAMGIHEDDAIGLSLFDLIAPDQRARFTKVFRRVLREQSSARLETAFVTRSGDRIPVEGSLRAKLRGRTPTSVRAHFHDVSRRKRMEAVLRTVLEGTSGSTGGDFFRALVRHIAESLGARCGLVGEIDPSGGSHMRTLAIWNGSAYGSERVVALRRESSVATDPAGGLLPRHLLPPELLADLGANSYLSVPMTDGRGRATGLLGVLHDKPVRLGPDALHILTTFGQRAGAELERVKAQRQLESRERYMASLAAFERALLGWGGAWPDLHAALGLLGDDAGAGRVYLFERVGESEDGSTLVTQRAEWCAAGVSVQLGNPEMELMDLAQTMPDIEPMLMSGQLVVRNVSELEGWFQEALKAQDIRAFAVAPFFRGDRFAGFLGFDDCTAERIWTAPERDFLTSAASAVALALERSQIQARLDGILTSIDQIVWSISARDRSRIYLNPAVEAVLGRAPDEFYADRELWFRVVHEDDREAVRAFADSLLERESGELEYRIIRPDGTVRWLRDRGHVTRDEQGRPLRIDGLATDVTKEIATKRRTESFSTLGRRLLEAKTPAQAARIIFDAADEMIGWDSCWLDLGDPRTGEPPHPVLYMDIVGNERVAVTPGASTHGRGALATRIVDEGGLRVLRGDPRSEGELSTFDDGGRPSRSLLFVPIRSGDRIVGIMSIQSYTPNLYREEDLETLRALADYCAGAVSRTEAEAQVYDAERRARAMLDAMPDLVFRMDREGCLLDFRASDEALLLTSPDEVLGGYLQDRLPQDVSDIWMERIQRSLATQEIQRFEYELKVGGESRHFESRMAPCAEDEVLVVARDISARRRAEEDRLALERGILESHRLESLGVLAGGIAHDFNNLLTSILGYASLAQMKTPSDAPVRKYLRDIEDATQSAAELALLMLAYSGKGQFVVQPLDLREVLSSTEGLLYSELLKLRSIMVLDVPDELPAIEGDQTQLRQVMLNLVLNASQAMRPDGGIVRVALQAVDVGPRELRGSYVGEDLPGGRFVRIEVSDTGCGMAPETLARVFDPFFTTKEGGRGLGLAAVVGIVRGHGGALRVESRMHKGTTFSLWFPVSEKPVPRVETAPELLSVVEGGLVLVVDDEAGVRNLTRDVLESAGYRVLSAEDGREGVDLFRKHQDEVSAVLLDMTMPRMSGVEALRELRTIRSDARVLISSGYSEAEAVNRFDADTPDGFIHKPYRAAQLLLMLEQILSQSGARAPA